MPKILSVLALACIFIISGCTKENPSLASSDGNEGSGRYRDNPQPGIVTAGEWNDLENWSFWQNLGQNSSFSLFEDDWGFYTQHRVELYVTDGEGPIRNAHVELRMDNETVWEAKSDYKGMANVWVNLFQKTASVNLSEYSIFIDGAFIDMELQAYGGAINTVTTKPVSSESQLLEIAFVVDATGSMGDELEFLKADLQNVLQKVKITNPELGLRTASVFYRDVGDEYVTRQSPFSYDVDQTIDFIKRQSANGGGDYREAVHTAMNVALNDLQWSASARTKIVFFLLDAPPHFTQDITRDIRNLTAQAAKEGIVFVPVAGSGIDKETEFLMRHIALATNGTYVFITDDSGVGNDHIDATVGEYQMEFLNNLMERLISEYAQ
jgi:hypothetical protein